MVVGSRFRSGARRSVARASAGLVAVAGLVVLGAPGAEAATVVRAPRPTYVDVDTLQVPQVRGVRYTDDEGRTLSGRVEVPAADENGFREVRIGAEPTSGYVLSGPNGWEEFHYGQAYESFSTQQGTDLLTVERSGCDVVVRNDRRVAVDYEIYETFDFDSVVSTVGDGTEEGEHVGLLQPGESVEIRATEWPAVLVRAQYADDTSWRTGDHVDTFDCGLGRGTQRTRVRTAGCELSFGQVGPLEVTIGQLFYRDADGWQRVDGIEDDTLGDAVAPISYDFGSVGRRDLRVYWGEYALVPEADGTYLRTYFGSATVCDGSPAATRPSAPGRPSTRVDGSTITVAWPAVTADGGSPVTGYVVHQTGPAGSQWREVPADQTRLTLRNQPGGTATFRVYASNRWGNSPASPDRSATVTSRPGAPAQPAANVRGRDVTLSWSPPRVTGGLPVTGYVVQRGNLYWALPATSRSLNFRGLPAGTHHFRVYATNALGNSAGSPVRTVAVR